MTIFLIILAVYLLSVVAMYFITRFMYLKKHPTPLAPVWSWVAPIVNTFVAIVGFALCWNYFPITGLEYWKKKWDGSNALDDTSHIDASNRVMNKEIAA
jgi:Na+/proline symporter